jgi:hypothetical protein
LHKRANVAQKPKPHQFFAGTLLGLKEIIDMV